MLLSPLATPREAAEAQRDPCRGPLHAAMPRLGTILRGQMPAGPLADWPNRPACCGSSRRPSMTLPTKSPPGSSAGDGAGHDTAMMDLGYDGAGVTVAVADSGLDSGEIDFMHPDIAGRVQALLFLRRTGGRRR